MMMFLFPLHCVVEGAEKMTLINNRPLSELIDSWGRHNRRIVRTTHYRPTISFFSRRHQRSYFTESWNEYCNLIDLESRLDVLYYDVQPLTITYDGHREYTPDVALAYQDKLVAQEIKDSRFCITEEHRAQYEQLAAVFAEVGYHFELVQIDKRDPWFTRQKLLMPYCDADWSLLNDAAPSSFSGTISQFACQLGNPDEWLPRIYAALFFHVIQTSDDRPISLASHIEWGGVV